MKKQSIAIIGVIAFVLAVAVGYALFSDQLTITGTAKAEGNFDYDFVVDEDAIEATGVSENGVTAVAEVDEDKDVLTITVDKLLYPGATVKIPVKVENTGSIAGKLETIAQSGIPTDSVIKVEYTGPGASELTLAPGASHDMTITVTWPEDFANGEEDTENVTEFSESISFSVGLTYQQATGTTAAGE